VRSPGLGANLYLIASARFTSGYRVTWSPFLMPELTSTSIP